MRYFHYILLTAMLAASCADDNNETGTPGLPATLPAISHITLQETSNIDNVRITLTDNYSYSDNLLTAHSSKQQYTGMENELGSESTFDYPDDSQAVWKDNHGNSAVYQLDEKGYATACTYQMGDQTRSYLFTYTNDYLTQIEESIDGARTGELKLDYDDDGNLSALITPTETYQVECLNTPLNGHQLPPCLLMQQLYPLSLHTDALYARLLGKQSTHWVSSIRPGNREYDEETTYSYTHEGRRITRITEKVTNTSKLIDGAGKPTTVTSTATRSIAVSID